MPKQPARLLHTPNRTGFGGRHGVLVTTGNHVTNPLVRPVPVMMIGDGFANMTDSVLINQNEAIHNRPDLAHEPLDEGVCLRNFGRDENGFDFVVLQDMLERLDSAVAVVDDLFAGVFGMILKLHGEVSSLLFDPTLPQFLR